MTLVEVMLAIAIIGGLATLILSKIDINAIFAKLGTTQEEVAVRAIGKALTDYRWAHQGDVPLDSNITATLKPICKNTVSKEDCDGAGGAYLQALLTEGYLEKLPVHTSYVAGMELMTGYKVQFPYGTRLRVTNPSGSEEFVH